MPKKKLYNPYCLVNLLYFEIWGKPLYCKDCYAEDCECKKVRSD